MKTLNAKNGFTLIEAMISVAIIGIVVVTLVYVQGFMSKTSVRLKDRAFATEKAVQMMEELRSLVTGSEKIDINVLDDYDDGSGAATYFPVLTTDKTITSPTNPISGNISIGNNWKYLRHVTVVRIPDDPYARQVTVRVYANKSTDPAVPDAGELLAETLSVLRTISSGYVPTQIIDLYVICIGNVAGWWSSLPLMVPTFETMISDLRLRNPGLNFRIHYITRHGYGRDPYYTPFINDANHTSDLNAIPYAYFYPGLTYQWTSAGVITANDFNFYDPGQISGRLNVDNTVQNAAARPVADMYNHAMRYLDEVDLYNTDKLAAEISGEVAPEKSLRMILEDMNISSVTLRNILFINLHGELLPLPPIRNYSDPAKDPDNYPYARLVTHPERLYYGAGSTVNLRVYPFSTNISTWTSNIWTNKPVRYGITGEYYARTDALTLTGSATTQYDPYINYTFALSSMSVRWTGMIHPKYTDTYVFEGNYDDGMSCTVDGTQLWNDWANHTSTQTSSGTAFLNAGHSYPIEVTYYNRHVNQGKVKLYWQSTLQQKEIIRFDKIPVASVWMPSDTINTTDITVKRLLGGPTEPYSRYTLDAYSITQATNCAVTYPAEGGTLFTLYDTPVLNSTSGFSSGGLKYSRRLYGYEYIPCPITNIDFDVDLTRSSETKNTARWVISVAGLANGAHPVKTAFGTLDTLLNPATDKLRNI